MRMTKIESLGLVNSGEMLLHHLAAWKPWSVLVVGDFMLDQTVHGAAERISPDAPVPVFAIDGRTPSVDTPGGSGNVGQRRLVHQPILAQALVRAETAQDECAAASHIDPPDVWSSPFTVAFISVGFRRLRFSMPGVLGLLEQQRPDILILGDLGVANNRIGRLKLQLEASVDEEWVFLKNISNSPGYPVGIGAMVHVSAAKFITQLEVSCPPGLDQQEWALAVGGRILHLELNRPDADGRIWFVGLNQHVAANGRDQSREHVLSTLAHIANLAKTHGWKLVILGDANAAPPGGRWGYSYNTRTGAADKRMNDWQAHTELCEICSTPLQPTWKACLLPKKATLDRAWVYPVDLPVSKLLVKWA
jgi:hypothetical protein